MSVEAAATPSPQSRRSAAAGATTAVLYRMVMEKHVCPWGLKSKDLLQRRGLRFEDRHLKTREEVDAFKAAQQVKTTPQAFIDGERIGGYDDLRRHFGLKVRDPAAKTYRPVIAVFAVAALIAAATLADGSTGVAAPSIVTWLQRFVATAMCILALLKLQDVESFSTMFLGYDLLARRWVPYSHIYPYAELAAGVLMLAGAWPFLSVPIAFVVGGIGAVSVFYAVYVQRRELKCACVGGSGNVPLGFVSLTENVMMVAMAVWMGIVHR